MNSNSGLSEERHDLNWLLFLTVTRLWHRCVSENAMLMEAVHCDTLAVLQTSQGQCEKLIAQVSQTGRHRKGPDFQKHFLV